MSIGKIKKYLTVEKSQILSKVPASITLDLSEYKNIDEEYGEKLGLEDIDNVIKVPGFFTIEFPDDNDKIDFFFPYDIYLNKSEDTELDKDQIKINFKPEELIVYGNFKNTDANISILSSMFQNGAKYLGNKPDMLISSLWQQLKKINNVSIHHIEILVSQLYGTYDKSRKQTVPLRLTGLKYDKKYILNLKQSSHELNNVLGFMYGHSNDSLRTSVSKKKSKENSFFEDVAGSHYDKMVDWSKKGRE